MCNYEGLSRDKGHFMQLMFLQSIQGSTQPLVRWPGTSGYHIGIVQTVMMLVRRTNLILGHLIAINRRKS